jgi:hypothetical protein
MSGTDLITPAAAFRLILRTDHPQEPGLADEIIAAGSGWSGWFRKGNRPDRSREDDAIVVAAAEAALKKLRDGVRAGSIALYGSFRGDQSKPIPPGDQADGELDVFGRKLEIFKNGRAERAYADVFCSKVDVERLIGSTAQPPKRLRARPAQDRASEAIATLYPTGIPSQADLPNDRLLNAVLAQLKATEKAPVDKTSVLRASGRRRE